MQEFDSDNPPQNALAERFRTYMTGVVNMKTGDFNSPPDSSLQIAAVVIAMNAEGYLEIEQSLFHRVIPFEGANLEEAALKFTGIDPFHPLRIARPEKDVFQNLFKMIRDAMKPKACKRAILVGHNAHFDHGFVRAASARHGLKRDPFHPFSCFDTATLSGLAFGQTVLSRACKVAGIDFDEAEAHSAKYDADRTAQLFCLIVNRYKDLGGWPLT